VFSDFLAKTVRKVQKSKAVHVTEPKQTCQEFSYNQSTCTGIYYSASVSNKALLIQSAK